MLSGGSVPNLWIRCRDVLIHQRRLVSTSNESSKQRNTLLSSREGSLFETTSVLKSNKISKISAVELTYLEVYSMTIFGPQSRKSLTLALLRSLNNYKRCRSVIT